MTDYTISPGWYTITADKGIINYPATLRLAPGSQGIARIVAIPQQSDAILTLTVELPGQGGIEADGSDPRTQPGTLRITDDKGNELLRCPVKGRASDRPAREAGNPNRNPLHQLGDTPTGTYLVTGLVTTGTKQHSTSSYGPNGALTLKGIAGDAKTATDPPYNRTSIWIHGGDLNDNGTLKSTMGCLRVHNSDMQKIVNTFLQVSRKDALACESVSVRLKVNPPHVDENPNFKDDVNDPPPSPIPGNFSPFLYVVGGQDAGGQGAGIPPDGGSLGPLLPMVDVVR